ncbi:MAG: DUF433 domain-containing protein [Verrucomicrobiia bacterium]|jgi:uncharacterized protein (DUF433 family)
MTTLLQKGIYIIPEAARLTRVSPRRIRRWLRGYEFKVKQGRHHSPAVWPSQLPPLDHTVALGFLDLLEVRCVDAFISAGVSWKTLRQAHNRARTLVGHSHPFCTHRFVTDGHAIFVELREKNAEVALWDMRDLQRVFERIIRPFLKNVEFDRERIPQRWWPGGKNRLVALDPRRSFGQPIIFRDGVPTQVLARSVKANDSVEEVARWFELSPASVRAAVKFEQQLAA